MKTSTIFYVFSMLSFLIFFMPRESMAQKDVSRFVHLSVEADPHSGSANFRIPISVPSGRGGIEPNVALLYNSSLPEGMLGVGWHLEFGAVVRSTKKGVLKYDDRDQFVLIHNNRPQELLQDPSTGLYHLKTEGLFMRIKRIDHYWVVTDKTGVTYYFGEDLSSREYDPENPDRIYRWCLNKVEDVYGNYMIFDYLRKGNRLYPHNIAYTGHTPSASPPFANISFIYEPRPQGALESYAAGFRQSMGLRLKSIRSYVGPNLQSRYDLSYTQSNLTQRSLLSSLTQWGSDGRTALAPVTLTYQDYSETLPEIFSFGRQNTGDNLWNYRKGTNAGKGPSNRQPLRPSQLRAHWGATVRQASGENWYSGSQGNLRFSSVKDDVHLFWTYLYTSQARTLSNLPFRGGGIAGFWINGSASNAGNTWSLKAGYNLVEMSFYHDHKDPEPVSVLGHIMGGSKLRQLKLMKGKVFIGA